LKIIYCGIICLSLSLSGCIKEENYGQALVAGLSLIQAATLQESQVKNAAFLSAAQMDKKSTVAPVTSRYAKRLARLTRGLESVDGLKLNYKVYIDKNVNAFAMADGTVRVYSGLLDLMPDEQVLAVIGHEIGHVKLKHSYNQLKQEMLTSAAFQAANLTEGSLSQISSSQFGVLAHRAISAQYSQKDELQADQYALKFLRWRGMSPVAMRESITTLRATQGSSSGFLSSHPSNNRRIEAINRAL